MTGIQTRDPVSAVLIRLLDYCKSRDWAGADPYDALNSEWLTSFPALDRRIPRLILTQCLKRSPINLRPLLRIPPTQNPKALALFISALVKMHRLGLVQDRNLIDGLVEMLREKRSPDQSRYCWGYSFPWQTRSVLVPRGAPNLVCTVFVANALLDVYDAFQEPRCLEMAVDAAHYIQQLAWDEPGGRSGFSYPLPSSRAVVHNANFLAAALLSRVHRIIHNPALCVAGFKAARYSVAQQMPDGGWAYSDLATQQWIDNFHTGFNLCALRSIITNTCSTEFEPSLKRGFAFYTSHFIREDGAAKYFHNHAYPIDIHSVAQSLITLTTLKDLGSDSGQKGQATLQWALRTLWSPNGYFHYRAYPFWKIRTSYMRWSQAWMMLALATVLEDSRQPAVFA